MDFFYWGFDSVPRMYPSIFAASVASHSREIPRPPNPLKLQPPPGHLIPDSSNALCALPELDFPRFLFPLDPRNQRFIPSFCKLLFNPQSTSRAERPGFLRSLGLAHGTYALFSFPPPLFLCVPIPSPTRSGSPDRFNTRFFCPGFVSVICPRRGNVWLQTFDLRVAPPSPLCYVLFREKRRFFASYPT